ncbi:hypothetical protein TNCV_4335511 [Trichonephila clavipes]|uniref:Uncharacterized protein n=1 Tax=Trichonephila clavipes TaxID=2585209 RepID=A0A8X6R8U0_TRICX|nr:hypothetical protein TNCV_4335511 [Trichonephila clavipes]
MDFPVLETEMDTNNVLSQITLFNEVALKTRVLVVAYNSIRELSIPILPRSNGQMAIFPGRRSSCYGSDVPILHLEHSFESAEWGWEQLIHLGSRIQSVEACPTDAHLEQQCLFGDTEERYHQPIDRSGLTPATRLQWPKETQRYPQEPFSSLREKRGPKGRQRYLSVVWTGKEEKMKFHDKRVENREGSLGYPVFTKDSKPLGKRKRSQGYLEIVTPVLT